MLDPRNEIIEKHDDFVRKVVKKTMSRFGLPPEGFDEYLTAAYLGLVEASERYDPDSGSPFEGYAYRRVRGAIIDLIRQTSDLSGTSYRAMKAMQSMDDLEEEVSRSICSSNDDQAVLRKIFSFASRGFLTVRLHGAQQQNALAQVADEQDTAEQKLLREEKFVSLQQIVRKLPEKERYIVEQHYFVGKSFVQIVHDRPELSKSWVSRLHARALDQLSMLIRAAGGL